MSENKELQNNISDTEEKMPVEETIKEKRTKKEKVRKIPKGEKKLRNKNALKKSSFVLVTTIVVVAVLVLINVLTTVLAQRLPITIDATAQKSNTLSDKNINFIKSIDEEVEVIVCASREGYTGSDMVNYAYNTYYVQENSTPYNYFNQTITLIEAYAKHNSNIKIEYVDTQSPSFQKLESESSIDITYGDILVRCTRDIGGKQVTLSDVVVFDDIYVLQDNSGGYSSYYGMSSYSITASNLESALSGAIYTVAASENRKVGFLSTISKSGAADEYITALESYNFEVTEIEGLATASTLENYDLILLVAPTADMTGEELRAIDKFLDNDGKKGKSFLVFGSTGSPETPNLNDFLEEWGIGVEDGIAYETDSSKKSDNYIFLLNAEDDLTKTINNAQKVYISSNNIALSRVYEEKDSRKTHVLLETSETAVVAPKGTDGSYTPPSSEEKASIPVAMVTGDSTYDDNSNDVVSYVGYFSSENLISSEWSSSPAGNMEFAVTATNSISGRSDAVYFDYKITRLSYMNVTDSQINTVRVVSMFVFPILVLIGGIAIWILRRNR